MRYESRIVEGLLRRYGLEKLFPGPMWKKGKGDHASALAHVSVAEILAGYGDTTGAIAHLVEGEKRFPLPEIRRAIDQLRRTGRENHTMENTNSVERSRARAGSGSAQSGEDRLSVTYLISSILGVTGGNLTLLRQANALADRGHRVAIVTRSPRPSWFDIRADVIHVAGNDPMWRSVPPSDVVISTYFANAGELAGVSAPVKVYFAQGDQFVFDDACASARPDVRKLHAAMKEMSRMSYLLPGVRFVANSRALASRVEKLYGRKADAFISVCVDQHVFAPLEKTPAGGIPRILIVGPDESGTEIEPLGFKGMADARRALELLRDSGGKFTAVRISNTPPLIFRGFPGEFHIAPSDEGKRMLFGTADILVYASHYDSCPRPPLEAMAAGVAVVCTSTAGALEYCRDGENALLVPPRSPEQIAGAVRRLIRESDLREKIVRGGRETAARFPQEREWDELERLLLGYAGKESLARVGVSASPRPGSIDSVSAGAAASPEALLQSEVPAELPEEVLAAGTLPSEQAGGEDITAVHTDSVFARTIRELFVRTRPKKILETGTFMGTGTTAVIAAALRDFALDDSVFYSIEVNPGLHGLAGRNLEKEGLLAYVTLLNGLSVPRGLLPTREEIEKRTVKEPETISLYVDHAENERVENYFRETDFPDVADDLLGKVLGVFAFEPDFVLLDSGGHMGNVEFNYVIGRLKGPCFVMLDDIHHVKHHRSFQQLSADPRFEVIKAMKEKAGFCLAKFTPAAPRTKSVPVSELSARLAIAGDLFGKKMFVEAIGALEGADNIIAGLPPDAREEAAAGLETFRGMSHLGLSDLEKAKGSFERALSIRPGSTQACAGLGEVLYLAGLDTEAKMMFEHAVALSAENRFGASGLAKVNALLGLAADDNKLLASSGGRV